MGIGQSHERATVRNPYHHLSAHDMRTMHHNRSEETIHTRIGGGRMVDTDDPEALAG